MKAHVPTRNADWHDPLMAFTVSLRAFTSSGGQRVDLPHPGVTCIVGANNVGKSQLPREIVAHMESDSSRCVVLSGVDIEQVDPSEDSLAEWLPKVGLLQQNTDVAEPLRYMAPIGPDRWRSVPLSPRRLCLCQPRAWPRSTEALLVLACYSGYLGKPSPRDARAIRYSAAG